MFVKTRNANFSSTSNSSVDWECDVESQSWSSSASWSDDVESEATNRLWQQLQDIDSVLYGEASPKTLPPALRQEVAQWRATFPHLRVCGSRPPVGPRPAEKEEGQEEVYASHGEFSDECDSKINDGVSNGSRREWQEQLKHQVMQKIFNKVRPEVLSYWQTKAPKDSSVRPVSVVRQREPLLANRQSARKDSVRKQLPSHETDLGSILRVSPLPRTATATTSRSYAQLSRSSIVLPPIEPQRGSVSAIPLSVLGRQSRLLQVRTKNPR